MRLSDLMDNEISAIRDVEMNQLLNLGIRRGVYDLQGRKIADDESYFEFHPNVKGVYIINGEKRLIK